VDGAGPRFNPEQKHEIAFIHRPHRASYPASGVERRSTPGGRVQEKVAEQLAAASRASTRHTGRGSG
jgi:hypothetical protein